MTRGKLAFKQADVKRAVSGAKAAGMEVARVDIDPATNRISIFAAGATPERPENALDRWLEGKNAATN